MTASDSTASNGHDSDGEEQQRSIQPNNLPEETIELSLRVPVSWTDALDREAMERSTPGNISNRSEVTRELLAEHLAVDEDGEVVLEE